AASDEREHAQLFFAFARAHGELRGPGPLDITGALADTDAIAIVVATVREGCIAETISAMQLQRAASFASDPERRAALERVLAQELEHVDLAWSFVAWAYARGDESLRAAVTAAFADAERCIPRGPDVDPSAAELARWHDAGRLSGAELHAVALHTIRTLVRPSAAELAHSSPSRCRIATSRFVYSTESSADKCDHSGHSNSASSG
ncbi:MAG TPA: ferritin-like domain-containing protein, partial [Nannocystaceae bacterium]|nr:ferritin-like domain-containing protein [Nannocystaceae bacterium]